MPSWSRLIGMLHIPPLPGSPRYAGDLDAVNRHVLKDAQTLFKAGVHAMMLENFGDTPFHPGPVPSHVVAHMTAIASRVRQALPKVQLGINVLRNDGCAAMSIAHAVGADFIRVNVLCGARLTDQGLIQGIAHDLLRLRKSLGAERIHVFADVNVKHSAPLASIPLEQEVEDLIHRGGADALIVTGRGTGHAAAMDELKAVKAAAGTTPVYLGSGVTAENLRGYAEHADGFIVGTSLKRAGSSAVDGGRVRALFKKNPRPWAGG